MDKEMTDIFGMVLDRLIEQVEQRVQSDIHSNVAHKQMLESWKEVEELKYELNKIKNRGDNCERMDSKENQEGGSQG